AEELHPLDGAAVVPPATVTAGETIGAGDGASAEVVNTAPKLASIPDGAAKEGSAFTAAGSFTDPDPQSWSALVDYGERGGPQPLQLAGDKTFLLSHAYDDNGTFAVTVVVTDSAGASATRTFEVAVANVAPSGVVSNDGPIPEGRSATTARIRSLAASSTRTAARATTRRGSRSRTSLPLPSSATTARSTRPRRRR